MSRKLSSPTCSAILLTFLMATSFWMNACIPGHSQRNPNARIPPKIGIVYTQPHPVTNAIIAAFKKRITESIPDAEFVEAHGYGNKTLYPGIVRQVISENVDILVPVTTPLSIETLEQAHDRIPVVFVAVTAPLDAGLVDSLEKPGKSTGVSDNPPMDQVIDLVRAFLPQAKTIGIPFDPKDPSAVITADRAELAAKARGFEVERCPVTSETELRAAVRALAARVDALVIGMDNLMVKNAGIISETAMDQRKPLFAADDKSIAMGAVAGLSIDYSDIGRLGAEIVIKVLVDKQAAGSIAVQTLQTGGLFFNSKSLAALNLGIPPDVKQRARDIAQ